MLREYAVTSRVETKVKAASISAAQALAKKMISEGKVQKTSIHPYSVELIDRDDD